MDSNIPDITFDSNGICSYCAQHDELEKKYPKGDAGKKQLDALVRKMKKQGKKHKYDCIVGVSGGADSTFSLYLAVKLGLRPLAVLFDNGWNSEIAVSNIKNVTDKLGVDLETYVVDWEEFKSILISFLKASVPDTDIPSDIGIKSTLYRTAAENKIGYVITGVNFRTEGIMPRKWSYMDGRYIKKVHKMFSGTGIKHFPNLTLFDYINYIFIKKIKAIGILRYFDYGKDEIKKIISDELGWRDYGGKHFESIFTRFNQTKIRYDKFGYDMRLIEYAALVRSGYMSRIDALEKLKKPPYTDEQLEDDVNYVIKKLGLTRDEFDYIYNLPPKSYLDYPTYYPLFNKLQPLMQFISRFVKRI
ncbi:MAG: N-acetyl sugar amidotransferase [Calditrichaceae bacterium]|nr:N-acetyl sugar amidotransferase [Calditrichaceae bacterium]